MNDYPTLQLGDVGNDVRILQQLLKIVNLFPGSITGSFDTTTENAVKTFQRENNLTPTGIVTIEVWTYLLEQTSSETPQAGSFPILRLGDTGEDVKVLQQQLKTTLYYDSEITGEYDAETESAVRTFQLNNQILASGIATNPTWYSLEEAYSSLDCDITTPPTTEDTEKYIIQKGDTLYSIAQKFNTTVDRLKELNNLTSNTLVIGSTLLVPKRITASGTTYTVKRGDTLYGIAQAFNISVEELKKANNLTSNVLSIGQVLTIPKTEENYITYTVKKGDTLYSIARNYDVSVNELMQLNNLSSSVLTVGQTLVIPTTKPDQSKTYIVKRGDTLYSIAQTLSLIHI